MSRAFVKEDGPEPSEDPPERPVSDLPNYVTPRGLKQLEDWESSLLAEHAALPKGSSEPAVRRLKKRIERDLRYVRARLQTAVPVDAAPKDEVRFGARVSLRRSDGETRTLRIVGEDEAEEGEDETEAGGALISWASPFANALLGTKTGQTIDWEGASGPERWTVVEVRY